MPQYVIYRHGHDEHNQDPAKGLPEKMAVARVNAADAGEACRLALREVTLAAGQELTAEPATAVDAHEQELNRKAEAVEQVP